MTQTFKAMVVRNNQDGKITCQLESMTQEALSPGEVLIKVAYSSLNYKDMLAVQEKGGVIRHYPMIPGIDLSGTIVSSETANLKIGQNVLVTGFELGMSHTGGFAQYARVPANWVVPLPTKLSLRDAMILGTAGYTAALSVAALEENGLTPKSHPNILITGATGGVGSLALQILAKAGYQNLHALVRKDYQIEVAKKIGASKVVFIEEIAPEKKLIGKQQYHAIIDTVGGEVAASLIPHLHYDGQMTLCGNAGGIKLDTNLLPFILRGIRLIGIDSVNVPIEKRFPLWEKMATDWCVTNQALVHEISLEEISSHLDDLKNGKHLGRTIVKMD